MTTQPHTRAMTWLTESQQRIWVKIHVQHSLLLASEILQDLISFKNDSSFREVSLYLHNILFSFAIQVQSNIPQLNILLFLQSSLRIFILNGKNEDLLSIRSHFAVKCNLEKKKKLFQNISELGVVDEGLWDYMEFRNGGCTRLLPVSWGLFMPLVYTLFFSTTF